MGEEDDQQKLRKIAAAAYDYENDPRWADYWSNILIPPHMASRPDVVNHFKRKFYQRYIAWGLYAGFMVTANTRLFLRNHSDGAFISDIQDPDLIVEAMSTSSSSQPARSSAPPSSTPNVQTQHRSSGSTTRASGISSAAASTPTALRWDWQTIQFFINTWVFVVAVLAIFPLVPRNLSTRAYRLSLMGTACSSLYSLYSLYGKPRAWNLQAVQVWFQSVIATKDFIYFIYCLTFVTSQLSLKFAVLPILCRALEHVAKFLRRNFSHSSLYRKYLEELCGWVESNTTTLSILSSQAEIGIGFLLLISLVSWQRNIIQTLMYWQLLKLMYHVQVTASYHRSVWVKIGRTVIPLVHRYAPFLNTPLSAVQRWWLR